MATFRQIRDGLEILAKYLPKGDKTHLAGVEHDIVHACSERLTGKVSPEDAARLDELGWSIQDDYWVHYA